MIIHNLKLFIFSLQIGNNLAISMEIFRDRNSIQIWPLTVGSFELPLAQFWPKF